ncbi:hypothetical protein SAMN02745671_01710 [Anaerovibrio lipolyticus DSM 3074]|uniref:Uncharacterized protein n=2 Tax=Anaerovibrio lipolyticus TaxID=82374 RepID=A0A0B2K4M7_9FIRM|nr:hypothetical protein [Anaerovibrio lipolyticus]KHM53027.1 hypothetical protein NZ47_01300 [Anaerovibrio lipolyticus]MBO5588513.1 hypothetical protein [Anaerovibrio sp.]SHI79264.1 hypothetical protein SAMN02745671_01710 [Anaerovibrio lipolyticus DSM 3074]
MDNGIVLFAFRHAISRKGMVLASVTNYICDHIEELPNDLLEEIACEVNMAYDDMKATNIPGYLAAKRLVTAIKRELYNEEEE